MHVKKKSILSLFMSGIIALGIASSFPGTDVSAAELCSVDLNTEYQTIKGFGGMNHPEWAGDLTESQRKTAFGNGANELGFQICRVFVNHDRTQWSRALATAKYAQSQGAIVFASPWNPPESMCETFTKNGDSDAKRLKKSSYAAYAQHLNDFVKYMKDNGVNLYSISIQNEPDWGFDWTWWTEDECVDFLANYADVIECPVMSPESFSYKKSYYEKILANSKANANTDIWGTHFYGTSRNNMDFPTLENDRREIFMTEVYVPNSTSDADTWPEAIDVSENIHNGMVVGNMNAYVWWYIRRSYGPMKESGAISKRGYCMAQYSKFVRSGDIRIKATEQPSSNVYVSAYKNPDEDTVTIVAVNKGGGDYVQNFSLGGESISGVERYRTTASENLAYTAAIDTTGNDTFSAQLPSNSVSTFVVSLGASSSEPDENGYYFHDTFEGNTSSWTGHGSSDVTLSGRIPYQGTEALLVQNREKAWNGTERSLSRKAFTAGSAYSFSVCAAYADGSSDTQKFLLSVQYKDSDGTVKYDHIAEGTAVKGDYVQLANQNYVLPSGGSEFVIYVETESGSDNFYIDEAIGAVAGTKTDGPKPVNLIRGDVSGDGKINIPDLVLAKSGILNGFGSNTARISADVNQNGKVTSEDVTLIISYLFGKITEFPVEEPEPVEEPSVPALTPQEYMNKVRPLISGSEAAGATNENAGTAYGTYKKETIYSSVCKRNKSFNVLLPAGYSTSKKYPVVYILHGYWGDEDALLDKGDASLRLRQIIGNAIASGEAEDMIAVFPDIYASDTQDKCDGLNAKNNLAYDNFINLLTKEIMPFMEKNYSIKTGRDNTAITGFSMGGRESLFIGFSRPDLFGYVGAMCPAPGLTTDQIKDSDLKFGDTAPYMLLVSAGSNDTLIYQTPAGYHDTMTKNNTDHIWHYVNGGDHGGKTIRPHVYFFIRHIFKATKQ
ncbi:MAG: alpha/beta hydrolase-fold protein [Oscillospiraceae bacterium]|nr:alpha/beta hydrolase-fold protein [Oscillospiraceae bacterium]